jgi:glutathione peroxidase
VAAEADRRTRHWPWRFLLLACALVLATACLAGAAEPVQSPVAAAFGDSYSARVPDPFPPEALIVPGKSRTAVAAGCPALLDYRLQDLRGRPVDLCAFKGKVLLMVNTASYCGYTPQYKGLEALQERYAKAGLVVMGFPTNDFGGQEPGTNADIQDFCEATYGVKFPMFGKITVLGSGTLPLFAKLMATRPPTGPVGPIEWNFEKFLVGRDGTLLARYRSPVEPDSQELTTLLQRALGAS